MNTPAPAALVDVAEFYAHAIALEQECDNRLGELTSCLHAHHNPDAADVFRRVREFQHRRLRALEQRCGDLALPRIAPWKYLWHSDFNLENLCMVSVHYLMTPLEALELVQSKLAATRRFYAAIARDNTDQAIIEVADWLVGELDTAMGDMDRWHDELEATHRPVMDDTDPPNQPL